MLHIASRLLGLPVYTRHGTHLGTVHDVGLDTSSSRVDSLYITGTDPRLVPDSASIQVPFRWVQDLDDIVVLRYFPEPLELESPEEAEIEFDE